MRHSRFRRHAAQPNLVIDLNPTWRYFAFFLIDDAGFSELQQQPPPPAVRKKKKDGVGSALPK